MTQTLLVLFTRGRSPAPLCSVTASQVQRATHPVWLFPWPALREPRLAPSSASTARQLSWQVCRAWVAHLPRPDTRLFWDGPLPRLEHPLAMSQHWNWHTRQATGSPAAAVRERVPLAEH